MTHKFIESSPVILRESAAELLAMALIELFPGIQLVYGGSTEKGFFYDFSAEQQIDTQAIPLIEEKMRGLIKANLEISTIEMMKENGAQFLEHKEQFFKAATIRRSRDNIVKLLKIGEFYDYAPVDLLKTTFEIGSFKLFDIETTSRYIPEEGEALVKRIEGAAFFDKKDLKDYIKTHKAALKYDYRKLGQVLQLFFINNEIAENGWVWLPRGIHLKNILLNWWANELKNQGFELISTPALVKKELMEDFGSFDFSDEFYEPPVCQINEIEYVVPVSATPIHAAVFQSKEGVTAKLPVRYAECKEVFLNERLGSFNEVSSSKLFLVDFAHIFCNLEFLEKEIISSLQFIDKIIKMFGFEYHWCLSLPKLGGEAFKDRVARSFCSAFEKTGITFISIEQEDRLARPMAEAWLIDSFGREWKGPTIEVDLKTSQRLKVKSRNSAGTNHSPLIVVISLFRSLERFIALLIEHFKEQIGSQITLRLCSNKAPQNSEGPQAS